jgi:O-antigen/teichoic acid export membrane protein
VHFGPAPARGSGRRYLLESRFRAEAFSVSVPSAESQVTEQQTPPGASTRREIAVGATWMLAFKLTERSLSLVSTVVLARMLLPADFGILAMAISLAAMLELMTAFSFDVALLQRHQLERKHLDTAWTFNVIFAILIFLLMLALAGAAAGYFREPQVEEVIYVLAAAWLIQGFENIGLIGFRREMRFDKEYRFLAIKKLIGVAVTVPLAIALRSYWALVIGMVASRGLSVLLSYQMHPYRPRLSLAGARDLLNFSGWLLVNNVLSFFHQRATDLIVGRIAGAQALGLYNISFELSNLPTTEIAAPINRAVYPGFAKLARERGQVGKTFLDSVGVMAMFTVPAGFGLAAIADPLIRVLLGANWLDAIPLIPILAVSGAIASIGNNSGAAVIALGAPHLVTAMWVARLAMLIPALIIATEKWGVAGTAWAVLAVTAVITPLSFAVVLPRLELRARHIIGEVWRPFVATAAMYYFVIETIHWLRAHGADSQFALLFAGVLAGIVCYAAAIIVLWALAGRPVGAESLIHGWASSWLRTRLRRGQA